jgi:DDE family transposase
LLDDHTGGDPMQVRKFVRRSLRNLAKDLQGRGHRASHTTVGKLLREQDYSPKANRKRYASTRHPDRDRQFRYIARQKRVFLTAGLPVISIDTKKKELIGNFQQRGRRWCHQADAVSTHDFKTDASAQAVPYGLYILNQNRGYVRVGVSASTAEFAVDTIASWWQTEGRRAFPHAGRLLILADSGGSNGSRPRLWKARLQTRLVDRFGLAVTVCHYPTGASHYNPVEHRLFGPISVNWAGQPLRSLPLLLACIRGTKTDTGLQVRASLNRKRYKTKIKVSDQEMRSLNLKRHKVCPNWNYTIKPRQRSTNSVDPKARSAE